LLSQNIRIFNTHVLFVRGELFRKIPCGPEILQGSAGGARSAASKMKVINFAVIFWFFLI